MSRECGKDLKEEKYEELEFIYICHIGTIET
jgi:hypothetical protein